ncbi:MAG: hypothetical protein RLZZ299_1348 [Pseudomonadota bacterium]
MGVGGGTDIAGEAAAGAAAVRARTALLAGDVDGVLAELSAMDAAHHVEVLLGAALRDARDGFGGLPRWWAARARPWDDPAWRDLVAWLVAAEPDDSLDVLAAGVTLGGAAGALRGRPEAPPREIPAMEAALRWLEAGGDVGAWLGCFGEDPHARAVIDYLEPEAGATRIRAQGVRPLLVLAALRGPPGPGGA